LGRIVDGKANEAPRVLLWGLGGGKEVVNLGDGELTYIKALCVGFFQESL
jgi:hypothetical protein